MHAQSVCSDNLDCNLSPTFAWLHRSHFSVKEKIVVRVLAHQNDAMQGSTTASDPAQSVTKRIINPGVVIVFMKTSLNQ